MTPLENKEVVFWDCDDSTERLQHETIDEAVQDYLDSFTDGSAEPGVIEVFGYARIKVNQERFKAVVLEAAETYLAENFDGEDGHEQCDDIKVAAGVFVGVYLENYTPWGCQIVKIEKVDVKEWKRRNP